MKGRSRPLGGGHDKDCVQCKHPVITNLAQIGAARNAFRTRSGWRNLGTLGVGSLASPRGLWLRRKAGRYRLSPGSRCHVRRSAPLSLSHHRKAGQRRPLTTLVLTALTSARHSVAQHSGQQHGVQQHGVQRYSSSSAQRASAHRREHSANATVLGWAP